MTLSQLFPRVDPDFLHQKGVEKSEAALNQWIESNIDKGHQEDWTSSGFSTKQSLETHKRIHKEEPFTYPVCDGDVGVWLEADQDQDGDGDGRQLRSTSIS